MLHHDLNLRVEDIAQEQGGLPKIHETLGLIPRTMADRAGI